MESDPWRSWKGGRLEDWLIFSRLADGLARQFQLARTNQLADELGVVQDGVIGPKIGVFFAQGV
ncbi:MAG: hypothetical protein U0401_09725 [Anaerolineae bacterium]